MNYNSVFLLSVNLLLVVVDGTAAQQKRCLTDFAAEEVRAQCDKRQKTLEHWDIFGGLAPDGDLSKNILIGGNKHFFTGSTSSGFRALVVQKEIKLVGAVLEKCVKQRMRLKQEDFARNAIVYDALKEKGLEFSPKNVDNAERAVTEQQIDAWLSKHPNCHATEKEERRVRSKITPGEVSVAVDDCSEAEIAASLIPVHAQQRKNKIGVVRAIHSRRVEMVKKRNAQLRAESAQPAEPAEPAEPEFRHLF